MVKRMTAGNGKTTGRSEPSRSKNGRANGNPRSVRRIDESWERFRRVFCRPWSAPVLRRVATGPIRFNALRSELKGLSAKTLASTLRAFHREQLVVRKVLPRSPVAVEYSITPKGKALVDLMEVAHRWHGDWADYRSD